MHDHGSLIISLLLAMLVGTTAVADGTADKVASNNMKPVSASELQGILTEPAPTVADKCARLFQLANRPLEPEAIVVAKDGLRTNDAEVIQALSSLLVKAGRMADVVDVLTDVASHPPTPYDRWVGAVGVLPVVDASPNLNRLRERQKAVARAVEQVRNETPRNRREFLEALAGSEQGRLILVFTSSKPMEQFLADMLIGQDGEMATLALRVLSRDPNLYYFPARGLPGLARFAEGNAQEEAATAATLLRTIISADKPANIGWGEWSQRYAADTFLLQTALSKAVDPNAGQTRFFAIRQALSLAADVDEDEFVRCAGKLLTLAKDEKEKVAFRAGVVAGLLVEALGNTEAPSVRTQVRELLLSWLDSPALDLRLLSINRLSCLPSASQDQEIGARLASILKDKAEPYLLRAAAAGGLHFMGDANKTELARAVLTVLRESEPIPTEEKASLQLRAVLSEITGLPANSPISAWETLQK